MKLEHDLALLWEEQANRRNVYQKFALQEVTHPVGQPNRHILEILLTHRDTLVTQNHRASVRLHHWYTVSCVLYIQVCSFTTKRLEQICTLSTERMFN